MSQGKYCLTVPLWHSCAHVCLRLEVKVGTPVGTWPGASCLADKCASVVQPDSVTCCRISQWLLWQRLEEHPCLVADVDGLITQALLTGNFESAVDLCLHDNRMADAIILAIAGGQELLSRTQEKYFAKMRSKITRVCVFRSGLTCSYAFGNSLFHLKVFLPFYRFISGRC